MHGAIERGCITPTSAASSVTRDHLGDGTEPGVIPLPRIVGQTLAKMESDGYLGCVDRKDH